MKRVKVFSPRRQPIVVELPSSNTFADARARIRQEFKTPGTNDVLLLHGEVVRALQSALQPVSHQQQTNTSGRAKFPMT
eukprot:2244125-Rhodomonas_salina.3